MPPVIGIRCVESGYLPAKVGRFTLSRSGLDPVPLRRGMPLESIVDGQRTRLPNTDIIYQMSGSLPPKTKAIPGAVMISTRQLPLDLLAPFIIAEKPFLSDVTQFCDQMVFLPFIEHNGEWSQGFAGQGRELARALDANDPGRTMFVNLYDQNGARYKGENLHWTVSPLLAGMKLSQILRMIGVSEASPSLTEYYLSHYQGTMISRIMSKLRASEPGCVNGELYQIYQGEFAHRSQISLNAQSRLSQAELSLLPSLE